LIVRGGLSAAGSEDHPITFTADSRSPQRGSWKGILIEGGSIRVRHIRGKYAQNMLKFSAADRVSHIFSAVFTQNDTAINYDGLVVDTLVVRRSLFANNTLGLYADSLVFIINSLFRNNDVGLRGEKIGLTFSEFSENRVGAVLGRSLVAQSKFNTNRQIGLEENGCIVRGSDFEGNQVGLFSHLQAFTSIRDNQIRANEIGIRIGTLALNLNTNRFEDNVICDNRLFNVQNLSPMTILMQNNCWCLQAANPIGIAIVNDNPNGNNGAVVFTPFEIGRCLPDRVYPGDTNFDQEANVWDLLPIGLFFGRQGPVRDAANDDWVGQPATDWLDNLPNGVDLKHVDCNGDGVINWLDIGIILRNYRLRHFSQPQRSATTDSTAVPLFFGEIPATVNPGDTLRIPIMLGTEETPAVDLYGIAFNVIYDPELVKESSVEVNFFPSWLGLITQNMAGIYQDDYEKGQTDIALSKIDLQPQTGQGRIAVVVVVISDDIAKTSSPFVIDFGEVTAINEKGEEIDVLTISGESDILTNVPADISTQLLIYPNPTTGRLSISSTALPMQQLVLIDLKGRVMQQYARLNKREQKIDLNSLTEGLYILRIKTSVGILTRKIVYIK